MSEYAPPTPCAQKLVWLSDREVGTRYGVSRISIWRWSKENESFPKPRKLGPNTTRWNAAELDEYDRQQMEAA